MIGTDGALLDGGLTDACRQPSNVSYDGCFGRLKGFGGTGKEPGCE
jgi:hypothetical protein